MFESGSVNKLEFVYSIYTPLFWLIVTITTLGHAPVFFLLRLVDGTSWVACSTRIDFLGSQQPVAPDSSKQVSCFSHEVLDCGAFQSFFLLFFIQC